MLGEIILAATLVVTPPVMCPLDGKCQEKIPEPEMVLLEDGTVVWADSITGLVVHDSKEAERDNENGLSGF